MASERQSFELSGPHHLTNIDWWDSNHRRCVAGSLVQGTCIQERDRQAGRLGRDALAEKWWSFFNFKLLYPLVDQAEGGSIFGAVYKWSRKAARSPFRPAGAPKIVVAFRGTITKSGSFAGDLKLDLLILKNGLHTTARFRAAFEAVKKCVCESGRENVWIAGHSLGAAMALLVGRRIAEEGQFLEAHLFNPPFISAPVNRISNDKVKHGLHIARSLVAAGLAAALKDKHSRIESQNAFFALRAWLPCLYVNPKDDICSAYVSYFTNQKVMQQFGAGGSTARLSIGELVLSAVGVESKALHRIPSARLTVSLVPAPDFKRAHRIHQWWAPDLKIQCSECRISEGPDRLK